MTTEKLSVVTGAFGYTGRYITKQLLSKGTPVKTITGRTDRPNPFGERVGVEPFNFDKPDALTRSLEGADVLYNTYWIRFAKRGLDHDKAVENTGVLIKAAEDAGVRRLVHIGVTNATVDSPIPYFRGKALLEDLIRSSSLSYAIVKPAFIFADGDILLNNIAWFLRRFPIFGMMGAGDYRVQPIYAEDLAEMVVNIAERNDNLEIDAIGPDTFTFEEIVRLTAEKLGRKAQIVHASGVGAISLQAGGLRDRRRGADPRRDRDTDDKPVGHKQPADRPHTAVRLAGDARPHAGRQLRLGARPALQVMSSLNTS